MLQKASFSDAEGEGQCPIQQHRGTFIRTSFCFLVSLWKSQWVFPLSPGMVSISLAIFNTSSHWVFHFTTTVSYGTVSDFLYYRLIFPVVEMNITRDRKITNTYSLSLSAPGTLSFKLHSDVLTRFTWTLDMNNLVSFGSLGFLAWLIIWPFNQLCCDRTSEREREREDGFEPVSLSLNFTL